MHRPQIVAVNGSLSAHSRTGLLIEALVQSLARNLGDAEIHLVDLSTLGVHLAGTLDFSGHPPEVAAALERIRHADVLVAASPVYKGGYTGLFKHLFDLVDPEALVAKPVLLAATGGSERHCLAVDHVFRPLFSFFRACTVPSAVYATPVDFAEGRLASAGARARVDEAAAQAVMLMRGAAASAATALVAAGGRAEALAA